MKNYVVLVQIERGVVLANAEVDDDRIDRITAKVFRNYGIDYQLNFKPSQVYKV
jgi:hypothetical protein